MEKTYKELLADANKLLELAEKKRLEELQAAISKAKEIIAEYKLTAEDCGFKNLNSAKNKGPTPIKKGIPKYANPANPQETYTGKGRKPAWLQNHITNGGKIEDLLINK